MPSGNQAVSQLVTQQRLRQPQIRVVYLKRNGFTVAGCAILNSVFGSAIKNKIY